MDKYFFALLLSWSFLMITTGCGASHVPTAPASIPTVTPFVIQPPLSDTENKAQVAALEFVQAVLLGREQEAQSFLAPTYSVQDRNLAHALGITGNPASYSLVADQRTPNALIFRLLLYYPAGTRLGYIALEQFHDRWLVNHIDRAMSGFFGLPVVAVVIARPRPRPCRDHLG